MSSSGVSGWLTYPTYDAAQSAFVLTLLAPLAAVLIAGRVALSVKWDLFAEHWSTPLLLLVAELSLLCGVGLLGLLGLGAARAHRAVQRAVLMVLQLVCAMWLAIELTALNFSYLTGSTLDLALVHYALASAAESWALVNASTPWLIKAGIALGALGALLAPWFASAALSRRRVTQPSLWRPSWRAPLAMSLALLIATLSPELAARPDLVRNATLNLLASALSSSDEERVGDAHASGFDTRAARLIQVSSARSVVIILMESTRASATTPYNPGLKTTPFLHKLAQQSLLVERAHVVMPHTSKALVSSLCGIPPQLGLPIHEASLAGVPARCLATLLTERGYQTAFFQSATGSFEQREQLVANLGYQDFASQEDYDLSGFEPANYFGREDNVMLKPTAQWLDARDPDTPLFLTFLTNTPHHQYLAPRRYGRHAFTKNATFNRYLNSVHYLDHFIEEVIELFKERGLYEDTIFVVMGDHGEGFGEHQRSQHDNVIYQEGLHIPLIIHDPAERGRARRQPHLATQLDLMPTLIELSGHQLTGGVLPGANLVTLSESRRIFAHCWYERRCMATLFEDSKYIHHFGAQPDERFDLGADPYERHTLDVEGGGRPELEALRAWRANVNAFYDAHHATYAAGVITRERPEVEEPRDIMLGDIARIIGVKIEPDVPHHPDQEITVTTFFEVLQQPEPGWKFFMHGVDAAGKNYNLGHVPVMGAHPLERWEPGTFIEDRYTFRIKNKVPPGDYELRVGIWHAQHGRLSVSVAGEAFEERWAPLKGLRLKARDTLK